MAEDEITPLKLCRKCGQAKPATPEHFKRSRSGNLTSPCRACQLAHHAAKHRENPEPNRRRATAWYRANPEKAKRTRQNYFAANQDKCVAQQRRYYREHVNEAVERARNWRLENSERFKELRAAWVARNRERVSSYQAVCAGTRRAAIANSESQFTAADVAKMIIAQKRRCWWCSKKLTKYHIDHRIPLAKGGSNGPENIVISCPSCNQRKNAKMPWEFDTSRLL